MPISFRQAGSLFVAGPNINIFPSGNTFAISGSAFQGGIGSGVTGVTSAGTGQFLFLLPDLSENTLLQKAISAGTGMNITQDGLNEILTFSVGGANLGSAVTGLTSAGTGNRLIFSSITNNNLVQKSLSGGTGIAIIDSGTGTLTFSSTSTASGTIISGTNAGTGVAIFSGAVGSNLVFRTIKAGANATAYLSGNDLIISATTGGVNGVTAITNTGGAANVLSSITNNTLFARTLSGSNGIDTTESGNVILIKPTNTTANRFYIAGTGGLLTTDDEFQLDSTAGTMAVGFTSEQNNTTSRLLIAAGTGNISQIRLTKHATTYSATTGDGDIWYATSGNTLRFYKSNVATDFIFRDNNLAFSGSTDLKILETDSNGTLSSSRNLIAFGVFNAISSLTITNTATSVSIITNSIIGSQTLLSSTDSRNAQLIAGKKYRFNAKGTIQTHSTAGQFNVNFRLGSVVIASSATFTLANSIPANSYFEIDTTFTIRTQGTGGTVNGSGKMLTDHTSFDGASQIKGINSLGNVTLDTTSPRLFDCYVTFTTANTNNIVIINESTLEYLN